ncbi:MAG: glycogen/starch/alpha-glucan phosphorylase, partial [Clostridia bacterium]|nr:glycogen/starch/alpha-glucan phosphorylase [Clostridia bacterium]
LDSAATHAIPLTGYGLRYKYGLFRQTFENGYQKEIPDDWGADFDPWSVRREELAVLVKMKGLTVRAVPYDMPVIGYKSDNVGTLRLWQTESLNEVDFKTFNDQKYSRACAEKNRAEDIVKFLYPNDTLKAGKMMRVKQQYVLSSASVQDMLRSYESLYGKDYGNFSRMYAVQLNDTHPVMAIPELIRLLMERGVKFDEAFDIAVRTFSYTNHTVMREALEVWGVDVLQSVAPMLMPVIRLIDERLKKEHPEMCIVGFDGVHMADLAVYATHVTNGVARIHTQILKRSVFSQWHDIYPDRFVNVTNGITQRRWLAVSNPELTAFLSARIGEGFITHLEKLDELKPLIDDDMCREFMAIKDVKKAQLAKRILEVEGVEVPEGFIYDVEIKRLHEYKRQLLNILCTWAIYKRLKSGEITDFNPMLCLFGGKSAPGYERAKAIIYLINSLAAIINADNETNDRLRVVFCRNYNCSYAESIIPAADISEQISAAGTEASGTGNMKLMLNGAVTLGTMDGANIEIVERAGADNAFIFGATVEELESMKDAYRSRDIYEADDMVRKAVDVLIDGTVADETGALRELYNSLLDGASWHKPDHYFVLKDFRSYYEAKLRANRAYSDRMAFARMALNNIASAGCFSSDRAVREYARIIWDI